MYMKTDVNLHKNLTETHINVDGNTSLQGKAARFSLFSCTYGVNKPLKKQLYKTFQPPAPLNSSIAENLFSKYAGKSISRIICKGTQEMDTTRDIRFCTGTRG